MTTTTTTTYNPNNPRPTWHAPRPLTVGTPVIIKLGPQHRQYEFIAAPLRVYRKWIPGVIDWISERDHNVMEIRINRNCVCVYKGRFARDDKEFYIRVEYTPVDCYNFGDVTVIRRQVG